ncbi:small subunit ribosomal protein S35 protein [Dioscorea alata]|uniref:Small subunit ribosomal protein S35 protein n=1 Tax=Dioscorea alata TaxID=55571 RepID=A0ACB7UDK8_DIOAL|nr:small subunit ribosomal protein S35 protein [Dioscorea alata]
MNRALFKLAHSFTRTLISSPLPRPKPILPLVSIPKSFFSSESQPPPSKPTSLAEARQSGTLVEDVSNEELNRRIQLYFNGDEEALPSIMEAILARKLSGKHEDTDEELVEELQMRPLEDVKDREFESDFEDAHETDEDIPDLYNARDYVQNRMANDEFFNMDDEKWNDMIREATEKGFLKDTKECEDILEDMLSWDKLLPDEIKQKVEAKFNELGDMCERGELEPEQAYELFKEFEDKMVAECAELTAHELPEEDISESSKNVRLDDPPGEGPILRWESRVVFAPGGDAWHPKNRKVKLSVTVKELGLSRAAFRRLRELVGKRYNSGKDELTITSERFEHREENRKDCLRTLYALIEDASKATKLVEETRNAYVKNRLKSNPQFMERLKAKTQKMQGQSTST